MENHPLFKIYKGDASWNNLIGQSVLCVSKQTCKSTLKEKILGDVIKNIREALDIHQQWLDEVQSNQNIKEYFPIYYLDHWAYTAGSYSILSLVIKSGLITV